MILKNCFEPKFSIYGGGNSGYFYHSYYNTREYRFYEEDELQLHKNKLITLLNNEGKGIIKKVLYTGKASNIPRHKLKAFLLENNIKKTSLIENSDTVIFDKKVIKDVYDWFNRATLKKIAIIPLTENIKSNMIHVNDVYSNTNNRSYSIPDLKIKLKNIENIIIYENDWNDFPSNIKSIFGNVKWENYYEQNTYRIKNLIEIYNTLEYYFQNPHGNIIWDDVILEALNNDGIDLDDDYLEALNNMLSSGDSGNIKLAMEMLTNVNLEKYGLTIALLLNKYKNITGWGSGNTNNSAFKTLDRYFLNKGIDWRSDYRIFSVGLYKNYSNDEEAKRIIEHFVLGNINSFLSENGFRLNGGCLQIDSFKISLHDKK